MTSFNTIRRCFAKLDAYATLLILTLAAFPFFAANAWALPTVIGYGHFTDRFGPHSIPGLPVGDKIQVDAFVDSSDPDGSPTISVEAIQGGTTLMLEPVPPDPLFEGLNIYYKFIDFDPGLTGSWEIIPTDSTGTGPSLFTNAIAEPEFLPLVEDIRVQGTPLGVNVAWTLPNLAGFDADAIAVRVIESVSGRETWQSDLLPAQATSFQVPAGEFQAGIDYVFSINLGDLEGQGTYLENSSKTFSAPFRFTALTVNGDFNLDGTVDAADYTIWRDTLGSSTDLRANGDNTGASANVIDLADFTFWKAHFGVPPGSGSGGNANAAVPEPATIALAMIVAALLCARPRRANKSTC